jgi:excisionase family DNA binding protein
LSELLPHRFLLIQGGDPLGTPGWFDMNTDLLTITEAAKVLRLKVSTLRSWIAKRTIPYVKLGPRRVFFRREDLEKLIESSIILPHT